jgi:exopolysaccharide biosynthesis WecB/TagA/CpsF family protein
LANFADVSHGTNRRSKISAFNCEFDPLTKREAVNTILSWIREGTVCRYVVTPNVHHLVLLQRPGSLRRSYRNASLTLVDGRPVTWALKLLHEPVPEVVPGSDLVPALFDAATPERPLSVFLLGAAPGVADRAKNVIRARWPSVRIVGAYGPPPSFENDEVETKHILDIVREAAPDLLVIGLGCPKQELWICRFAAQVDAKVAICAGATIDFIAGHRQRAPLWVQKIGCEWLFRALQEPRRMGGRYLQDVWAFPAMIAREFWKRRQATEASLLAQVNYQSPDRTDRDGRRQPSAVDANLDPGLPRHTEVAPASQDGLRPSWHRSGFVQLASVGGSSRPVRRVRDRLLQTKFGERLSENANRVLLTGHEGYIGCILAPLLVEAGYDVVGLDTGLFVDGTSIGELADLPTIDKDIRDIAPSDLEGFDAVLHLAALPNDPLGHLEPELTYEINLKATIQLAEHAKAAGVSRFVFSSSSSVFDAAGDVSLNEESAVTPITPYGVAKMWAERDIGRMADSGFCPTFLRIGTAYGAAPRMRLDLLVNNLVATAFTTGRVVVEGDGSYWRCVAHVQDVARAYLAVLRAPRHLVDTAAFNIGQSSENYRIRDIAAMIADVVPNCKVAFTRGSGNEAQRYRVDCSKVARLLPGFQSEWTLRRGIEELYEVFRRAELSAQDVEGDRFKRAKFLRALVEMHRLDTDLRWCDHPRGKLLTAAG